MEIHQSIKPVFQYSWETSWGKVIKGLTADKVLVTSVPPTLFSDTFGTAPTFDPEEAGGDSVGLLSMRAFGERKSLKLRDTLRSILRPVFGEPAIRYLSADYSVIAGGALGFHHDLPSSGAIYLAWHQFGPDRVVIFPEMGLEIPFTAGTLIAFDPAQPHGLLRPGTREFQPEDYSKDEFLGMVGCSVSRRPKSRNALGLEKLGPRKHAQVRKTHMPYAVCERTGAVLGL